MCVCVCVCVSVCVWDGEGGNVGDGGEKACFLSKRLCGL